MTRDLFRNERTQIFRQGGEGENPYTPRKPEIPTKQEELIIRGYLDEGLKPDEIARKHALSPSVVRAVINNARLRRKAEIIKEEVKEELFQDKLPILKAIAARGLVVLFDWMDELAQRSREEGVSVDEAKAVRDTIEKLHTMYQIETGAPTQTIVHKIEKTEQSVQHIIHQLQKAPEEGGDPFVSYSDAVEVEVVDEESGEED